ncbi:MAG: transcription elongation factor GreA [Flavobacteriales bacterium]
MAKPEYITEEGLKKLREELEQLEGVERPRISREITEARDKGDLSENAEYDAAKETQEFLEVRIAKIKEKLANVRVIDGSQLDHSKVSILSTVKVKNLTHGVQQIYTLVPEGEADLKVGKISINTPISTGLLGKQVGETAQICLPNGMELEFEILDIKFD